MNIRTAKLEDLGAIVGIYNQAIAAGQKTAETKPITIVAGNGLITILPTNIPS